MPFSLSIHTYAVNPGDSASPLDSVVLPGDYKLELESDASLYFLRTDGITQDNAIFNNDLPDDKILAYKDINIRAPETLQ